MRRIAFLFVVPIFLAGTVLVANGQTIPATPGPEECLVATPEVDDLYQIVSEQYEPAGSHQASAENPDPDAVDSATATVLMSVACTNANQQLAALSLFTNRYLAERFSTPEGADELGHLIAASSRDVSPAAPEDQLAVESVRDPELYADGRIALFVQTSNSREVFQDIVILAEVNGEWLIDEVLLGDETILKATPLASSH